MTCQSCRVCSPCLFRRQQTILPDSLWRIFSIAVKPWFESVQIISGSESQSVCHFTIALAEGQLVMRWLPENRLPRSASSLKQLIQVEVRNAAAKR